MAPARFATYASHHLEPPHRGREGIRAYWGRATADQEDLSLRFGEPVVSAYGRQALVEWWAAMKRKGLKKDLAVVRAGLAEDWSNGPVEGFVNKLKLVKRQGYGRAGIGLLRARVLAA